MHFTYIRLSISCSSDCLILLNESSQFYSLEDVTYEAAHGVFPPVFLPSCSTVQTASLVRSERVVV